MLHEARPCWDPDVNGTFFQLKLLVSRKCFCERVYYFHILKRVFAKRLLLPSSSCRNIPRNKISHVGT